ncbi:hypothetical protein M3223_05180 [Paenibacillus pasadenensis]|uniref:hypothetical protein n=1 Tax=Paenibacillus pasadenensis TaxID=217090 RepID=UPI00203E6317|nr:hypothetical protein [Paenibacillus pasadenensis]MCM3746745.1 hypothetical protein [Paenibacillus pasadenensis]
MLEAEQYGEAKRMLQFLLQCRGEDQRHYEEWGNLLAWLEMAFPESGSQGDEEEDDPDEDDLRQSALTPSNQDESYVQQVLYIMKNHPMLDQQLLALERAAHLRSPEVDTAIREWLEQESLHPVVQFKALQCLRRRGDSGPLRLERLGETAELEIDRVPLELDDYPEPVRRILERVESVTETMDPTLPHFARELWKECLQYLYGSSAYTRMLSEEEAVVDSYAAALHQTLLLAVYGSADEDEIRHTYGITDELRFRYEQASRSMRQITDLQEGYGEH